MKTMHGFSSGNLVSVENCICQNFREYRVEVEKHRNVGITMKPDRQFTSSVYHEESIFIEAGIDVIDLKITISPKHGDDSQSGEMLGIFKRTAYGFGEEVMIGMRRDSILQVKPLSFR